MLYVRLGAGSDTIQTEDISYQLYCNAGAGYESDPLTQQMVQLQSDADFNGGEAELLVAEPYKIMITPGVCTAAAVSAADGKVRISLGGTQTKTLEEGRYVYDVIVSSGNTFYRLVDGNILVQPGISSISAL